MRNKWVVTDELNCLPHDFSNARRISHHVIRNSSQCLDVIGYMHSGVHQALVAGFNSILADDDNGDLRRPRTQAW